MASRIAPVWHHRSQLRWWALAAVLLLVGVGCITFGVNDVSRGLPGPDAGSRPTAGRATLVGHLPRRAALVPSLRPVARSVPVSLRIPAIGLAVNLSQLGLNADRTVQVPSLFAEPGWYKLGVTPGQRGSAVILGHVDSYRGPAAFFELRTLASGDMIDVRLADGVVARFSVESVRMYPKTAFPADRIYGTHDGSSLQLVTCGGTFDSATGHYLSNVVVYSSLVSAS